MECMIEHLRFKIEGGILELVKFEWGVSKMMGEEGTYWRPNKAEDVCKSLKGLWKIII